MTNVLNAFLKDRLGDLGSVAGPKLDCHSCAKVVKCCDFQPFVANFLLGGLLERGVPVNFSSSDHYFIPLGLVAGAAYRSRHSGTPPETRGHEFACHFFSKQARNCEIWEFRPGECSTYFCEGRRPEFDKLSESSFNFESNLAQEFLFAENFSQQEVHFQVDLLNGEGVPPIKYPALEELYRRAWRWARQSAKKEV